MTLECFRAALRLIRNRLDRGGRRHLIASLPWVCALALVACAAQPPSKIASDAADSAPGVADAAPYRIERHAKVEGAYVRIGTDQVQIGPYRMARIDREDAEAFYLRIYEARPVVAPVLSAEPAPVARLQRSRMFRLQAFDEGLPREGQWRDDLAVADVDGDGQLDIASAPPRKSVSGRPVIFLGDGRGRWQPWRQAQFPQIRLDYGAAVAGDFDGDGRVDLGLAMHLRGFTVLRQIEAGRFERADTGLPSLETVASHGFTGTSLAWTADPAGSLLLLRGEGLRPAAGTRAPPALLARWTGAGWRVANDAPEALGKGWVRLMRADAALPGLWFAAQMADELRLFRYWQQRWTEQRVDGLPAGCQWQAAALAQVDHDQQADLVVACLRRVEETWWSQVELLRSQGGTLTLSTAAPADAVSALAFIRPRQSGGPDLVMLDRRGGLQLLAADGNGGFRRDHHEPAPDWRRGCAGHALHGADLDGDGGDEVVASFAGESSAFDPASSCQRNGAITAWKVTPDVDPWN